MLVPLLQSLLSIFILPFLALIAASTEINNIRALLKYSTAQEDVLGALDTKTSWENTVKISRLQTGSEVLAELSNKNDLLGGRFKDRYSYAHGKSMVIRAISTPDSGEMLENFCAARASFLMASRHSPKNSQYHIEIADIESLSPVLIESCNINSEKEDTESSLKTKERLELALSMNPFHAVTLYRAGIIFNQLGEKSTALSTFRKFQESANHGIDPQIIKYIASLSRTEDDLRLVLPRKYPLILTWAKLNESNLQEKGRSYLPIFESALKDILEEKFNLLVKGELLQKEFIDTLSHMAEQSLLNDVPAVQKKVFGLLSEYYTSTGNQFAAKLTKDYSSLRRVATLKALELSRVSPGSGSLYNWIHEKDSRRLALDLKSGNIGLFIPVGNRVRLITISGQKGQSAPDKISAKAWTSFNNEQFSPYQGKIEVSSGILNDSPVIILELPENIGPYAKLYFESGGTLGGTISNSANKLVRAYGE